jgi:hypothetical protein
LKTLPGSTFKKPQQPETLAYLQSLPSSTVSGVCFVALFPHLGDCRFPDHFLHLAGRYFLVSIKPRHSFRTKCAELESLERDLGTAWRANPVLLDPVPSVWLRRNVAFVMHRRSGLQAFVYVILMVAMKKVGSSPVKSTSAVAIACRSCA